MAISTPHTATSIGATFPQTYWRISGANIQYIVGQPVKHMISLQIEVFADAAASTVAGVRPVDSRIYQVALADIEAHAAANFIGKCYEWLVAHEELAAGAAV